MYRKKLVWKNKFDKGNVNIIDNALDVFYVALYEWNFIEIYIEIYTNWKLKLTKTESRTADTETRDACCQMGFWHQKSIFDVF